MNQKARLPVAMDEASKAERLKQPPPAFYHRKAVLKMADLQPIRERIIDELALQPSRKERGKYFCPLCGKDNLSIDKDGIHGKCFTSGCEFYGDVFDWRAAIDGISAAEATRRLIDKYQPGAARRSTAAEDFSEPYRAEAPVAAAPAAAEKPRGKSFLYQVEQAHKALPGSDGERYLLGRGFSAETLERFMLGYEAAHYFPGRGTFPAILFPYDRGGHYVGWRAIPEKHYDKPKTAEAGEEPVFNAGTLYSGEPVFVVESQLCAISIEQAGGRAVAIGGSGKEKLLKQIEKKAPAGPLIIALDNDPEGRKAQANLAEALEAKGLPFLQGNPAGDDCKDPNELLQKDPAALRDNISTILRGLNEAEEREKAERLEAWQRESAAGYIDGFMDELRRSKAAPAIPTGFPGFDRLLDGGLYPGLYIIGAITSLGKSTFTLQIADQIAAGGHDVLCFNLEMAKQEITAKSISRLTYQIARRDKVTTRRAKTTRDILASKRWSSFPRGDMELMAAAIDEYRDTISAHIWHFEGVGNIGVAEIRETVERHIGITGRLPVVIIDYLQILASPDLKLSDKQAVDKNVLELKRLSRDKGVPVFGISSLNRDNYLNPINNAAFKESGAIEYSSDCLIGLQFTGMDYEEGETDKNREKRIRGLVKEQKQAGNDGKAEDIELKILKNRNGKSYTSQRFLFTPRFNLYEERSEFTEVDDNPFTEDEPSARKKKPL